MIPEPPTAPGHVSVLMAYDKVLAVSICSKSGVLTPTGHCHMHGKAHPKCDNSGGYNVPLDANPFNSWATVIDCGDIPVTSYVTTFQNLTREN